MSEYTELIAAYEAEEGYPADSWIDKFAALPPTAFDPDEAADFLLNQLLPISETISCMTVTISYAVDFIGNPVKRIEYITGGWSGAEALINVMLQQFWIEHLHVL